ncbi:MAG TPA: sigma-E factor negative regulatory protein [Burkholderiales bacterium]|nr:sigma-E factor negative regulatory protein [Burkholderiales bacterium]
MKERLSELMDGELDDKSAAHVIEALRHDRDAVQTWRTYQLISDALRESRVLSADFTARFSERLAAEPTVFAPRAMQAGSRRWYVASAAAASFAAVAMVGWLAFAPQPQVTPAPVAQVQREVKPNIVPLPTQANDYLLAHQAFSPKISLQGMAPYVRTVSEETVGARR